MTLMLFLPRAYLRAAFAFFVGAGFLCFPAHSAAENASQNPQNPAPEPPQESKSQPPYRMAVHVDLVNVEVTVTDARGNFVGDLVRENFRVLDEGRSEEHTSELQSRLHLVCRLLLEKKKKNKQ